MLARVAQSGLTGDDGQAFHTVLNGRGPHDANRANTPGLVVVRPTARLNVVVGDAQDSNRGALRRPALVEVEAMLPVRISAIQFGLLRALHLSQNVVGKALNRIEVLALQAGVMRDVQTSAVNGFVGSGLEDVWTENASRCTTDDVNRRVVIHQLLAPCGIEGALHQIPDLHRPIDKMEHVLTLLPGVHHATVRGFGGQATVVALLSTAFGVEAGLVQNNGVRRARNGLVRQGLAGEDAGLHFRKVHIVVEQQRGLGKVGHVLHQGSVLGGSGRFLGQAGVTLRHFRCESGSEHKLLPTGFPTNADHDFRLQAVHVSELKQQVVVHRGCVLRGGLQGLADETV